MSVNVSTAKAELTHLLMTVIVVMVAVVVGTIGDRHGSVHDHGTLHEPHRGRGRG